MGGGGEILAVLLLPRCNFLGWTMLGAPLSSHKGVGEENENSSFLIPSSLTGRQVISW